VNRVILASTWASSKSSTRAAMQGRVFQLVNAYRVRGHLFAHVDPLGVPPTAPPELDLRNFELGPEHLDRAFAAVDLAGPNVQTLRDIIARLEETYCRSIGVEFTHIEDPEQRKWLQSRMESTRNRLALDPEEQRSASSPSSRTPRSSSSSSTATRPAPSASPSKAARA
jgi:2-oxoglutarate dehydrogenase E1 component